MIRSFNFLGFTHYCGQRHKTGTFAVWRITAKTRMAAKLKAIKGELHRRMHDRPAKTGAWLRSVVVGYYRYHAVPGNLGQLSTFRQRVKRLWYQALARRSQRAQTVGDACSDLRTMDTTPTRSASLSRCSLLRHSSFIRAVRVDALVRICAGAIREDRPYCDWNPALRSQTLLIDWLLRLWLEISDV